MASTHPFVSRDPKTATTTLETGSAIRASIPTEQEASEAFRRIEPELASVDPADLVRITTDVGKATAMALGAAPRIAQYRDLIVRELPSFAIAKLDKLADYALAAFYAHATAAPSPVDATFPALMDEATELRERLLVAAEAMVHFGLLDAARVATIRAGNGQIDTAKDLVACSAMFKEQWATLEGKQPVTVEEVERAGKLGTELMLVLGPKTVRAQVGEPAATAVDADRRARAFTLLVDAYESCRRAVGYLRWSEGDVDVIAPSMFVRARRAAPAAVVATATTPAGGNGAGDATGGGGNGGAGA